MDHNFVPSQVNHSICARCKYTELAHGSEAICEQCGNSGHCNVFTTMLLCHTCIENEKKAILENQSEEKQQERLQRYNENLPPILAKARTVDQSVTIKSDIYNAETIATIKVFEAIDQNPDITNKAFVKAQFLTERYDHFAAVVFQARTELETATSSQRAISSQLNELANQLREDERAKLKMKDMTYNPSVAKPKTSTRKPPTKKWNKAEVREAAAKFKVPVDAVQMICVARNLAPEAAAQLLHSQLYPPSSTGGKVN